jgi:hypothetical protein
MNWGEGEFLQDIGEKTIRKGSARKTKSGMAQDGKECRAVVNTAIGKLHKKGSVPWTKLSAPLSFGTYRGALSSSRHQTQHGDGNGQLSDSQLPLSRFKYKNIPGLQTDRVIHSRLMVRHPSSCNLW